jgi:hypothetical protein
VIEKAARREPKLLGALMGGGHVADQSIGLADIINGDLSQRWKWAKGRLSNFLEDVGVTGDEHSQSLYILPQYSFEPEHYLHGLEDEQLDNDAQWAKLIGPRGPNQPSIVLAYPVSKKVRIVGMASKKAVRNSMRTLFVEVHSRLTVWWLVNAWRSKQLANATWQLADAVQFIPAAACARSLIETAASVWTDARKLSEVWAGVKADCAAHGRDVAHHDNLMIEINKMLWGSKFDDRVPDLQKTYSKLQRTNVLTQIDKLGRVTDYPLLKDYQWLCNAVHPSLGGMLAFAAPIMGHETKTHAFQWVCEAPTSFRTVRLSRDKHYMLADTASFLKDKDVKDAVKEASDSEFRETTIQDALARVAILAVEVLEKSLDDALKVIDDIGLTTKAPSMASFEYWRNLQPSHANASCPCRSGRKAKHCLHRWTDPAPTVIERF